MPGLTADIVKQLTSRYASSCLLKAREGHYSSRHYSSHMRVHSDFPCSQLKFTPWVFCIVSVHFFSIYEKASSVVWERSLWIWLFAHERTQTADVRAPVMCTPVRFHSDWLQRVFQLGWVGCVLGACVWLQLLTGQRCPTPGVCSRPFVNHLKWTLGTKVGFSAAHS